MDKLTELLAHVHQVLEVDLPDLLDRDEDFDADVAIVVSEIALVAVKMTRICAWYALGKAVIR